MNCEHGLDTCPWCKILAGFNLLMEGCDLLERQEGPNMAKSMEADISMVHSLSKWFEGSARRAAEENNRAFD